MSALTSASMPFPSKSRARAKNLAQGGRAAPGQNVAPAAPQREIARGPYKVIGRKFMKASIRLCLQLVLLGLCSNAGAAGFPDRPIHLIVPFPPGGPASVVANIIGPELGERLEQKVIIDYRSGADGIVGSEEVAKAPPDGYTLLLSTSSHVLHPVTYNSLPFDTDT